MKLLTQALIFCSLCWTGLLYSNAWAHPLAPALLEIKPAENSSAYDVLWRLSAIQNPSASPQPELPAHCEKTSDVEHILETGAAVASRWQIDCGEQDLLGSEISINKLVNSGINVILRIETHQGTRFQTLLDARQTRFKLSEIDGANAVLQHYFELGIEHLVFGPDHLLFLLGLLLLVRALRPRVVTLTAFTLGHSITLSLAALGFVRVNVGLMELGIALSLVILGRELLRKQPSVLGRRPALMAAGFGLLHGLGFAAALGEVGLPQTEVVSALLGFNLGIEAAQIMIVCCLSAIVFCLQRSLPIGNIAWPIALKQTPAYMIGALAMLWCIERFMTLQVATFTM